MTRLSDNPQSATGRRGGVKFVPFTAFVRVIPDPGFGRRFETVRALEELANQAEENLAAIEDATAGGEVVDFADPVKFTPQFGDKTARLTIHGNISDSSGFTKQSLQQHTVINTGQILNGPGSHNATQQPSTELNSIAAEIKDTIEGAIGPGLPVFRLEVAGFIFGDDGSGRISSGRHFPLV